jgi:uncharacterized protein YkwD
LRCRPLLALAAAACAVAIAAASPSTSPAGGVGGCTAGANFRPDNAAFAAQVVQLVNQHRTAMGLKALAVSPTLSASAAWKARHMATYNYMAHQDIAPPVARSAGDRIAACGYANAGWGENIAAGYTTPASVVAAWLQSPGHKANIESPSYVVTGAGAAASANGVYAWAQDFGQANDAGSPPPTPAPTPPQKKKKKTTAGTQSLVLTKLEVTRPTGRVVAHVRVLLSPSGRPVASGQTACKATLGGRPLRVVVNVLRGGTATCGWRLASANHGRVAASIVVRSGGRTARAPFVLVQR